MNKAALSETISKCTCNMHDEISELYEALHPNGQPITKLNGKIESMLRRFMNAIRVEKEMIMEAIRETEENGQGA